MIEDVRHVSGSLERFLIDRGETVVRLPPRLMADARRGVRERGKSDPIDALAIARAALREGIETLPTARLAGPELEIRLLGLHRERLVDTRTRLINELRWQLHDLWPDWEIRKRVLIHPGWQTKVARRLQRRRADDPGPDRPRHDQPGSRADPHDHRAPRRSSPASSSRPPRSCSPRPGSGCSSPPS